MLLSWLCLPERVRLLWVYTLVRLNTLSFSLSCYPLLSRKLSYQSHQEPEQEESSSSSTSPPSSSSYYLLAHFPFLRKESNVYQITMIPVCLCVCVCACMYVATSQQIDRFSVNLVWKQIITFSTFCVTHNQSAVANKAVAWNFDIHI